jgi:hypothetical protein
VRIGGLFSYQPRNGFLHSADLHFRSKSVALRVEPSTLNVRSPVFVIDSVTNCGFAKG